MKALLSTVIASIMFIGCGYQTMQKDKDRAEERARTSENKNKEQEEHIERLQTAFSTARASSNNIWVTVTLTSSHAAAVKACEDINMSLPNTEDLAEFKLEIYDNDPKLKQIPFERFYAKDVEEDQLNGIGIILCRKGN